MPPGPGLLTNSETGGSGGPILLVCSESSESSLLPPSSTSNAGELVSGPGPVADFLSGEEKAGKSDEKKPKLDQDLRGIWAKGLRIRADTR